MEALSPIGTTRLTYHLRFTRGWTLQELIAPRHLVFYNAGWLTLPGMSSANQRYEMAETLSGITGIGIELLKGTRLLSSYCVARKLSWSSRRVTTRKEDTAYCLLGIFDINMPLLYGEEDKAFRRLQEEIIRSTDDLSIFAWKLPEHDESIDQLSVQEKDDLICGILAKSPGDFAACIAYEVIGDEGVHEYSISNSGIKTSMRMAFTGMDGSPAIVLPLYCQDEHGPLGLLLRQIGPRKYLRGNPGSLVRYFDFGGPFPAMERILLTDLPGARPASLLRCLSYAKDIIQQRSNVVKVCSPLGTSILSFWPPEQFDFQDELFLISNEPGRNFGIFDLNHFPSASRSFDHKIECSIIIIGGSWKNKEWSDCDYGIVKRKQFKDKLGQVRDAIERTHGLGKDFSRLLDTSSVPRTTSVYYDTGDSKYPIGVLSLSSKAQVDQSIAQGTCQMLTLETVRFRERQSASEMNQSHWSRSRDR